jgi:hypothetical protein
MQGAECIGFMMPRACGDGELGCALVSLDSVGICASASDDSACGVNASISSGGPSSGVGRLKSVQQICGAQGDVAGGGQLNSGRNTIEALADLNNGAVVVLGEREVRLHPSDPNVESLEWAISRAARKCPSTRYTGWAVQKTEEDARTKALARLLYAGDYALAGYRDES